MNLDNLKKEIRYSLGDIKEEKYEPERLLLVLSRVINSLNYKFKFYRKKAFIKIIRYKLAYDMPEDFYYLTDAKLNCNPLKLLLEKTEAKSRENSPWALVLDSFTSPTFSFNYVPEDLSVKYILHSSDSQDLISPLNVDTIEYMYDRDPIHIVYKLGYGSVLGSSEREEDIGVLELDYIARVDIDYTVSKLSIPECFYEAIVYKALSVLLADDSRVEVQQKSLLAKANYDEEVKRLALDNNFSYASTSSLTGYSQGV